MFGPAALSFGKSLGYYTGIFSTAVTASVNPTATMAALSALGAIENAYLYSPESGFFTAAADSLNGIPVINAAAELPIANPYAAVFLTAVAAVMIVLHSFAESKIVSQASIDKIDKLTGWIGVTALSIMPLLTTEAIQKTASTGKHAASALNAFSGTVSGGAPWYVWVLAIVTLVIASVVYSLCYDCVDNIGTICAAIPVKGLNIVEQIIKALVHAGMILLQITFPAISFIISIILAVLGILLFRVLKRITFYYKEVYIRPLVRLIKKNKNIAPVHKKLPRKIRKTYPGLTLAVPLFVFKGIDKMSTRSVIWFIRDDNSCHLLIKRPFHKIHEISISDIKGKYPEAELVECKRFYQIKTPDKRFNIVTSKVNSDVLADIAKGLGVTVAQSEEAADQSYAVSVN